MTGAAAATRRILDDASGAAAMTWVIAIMVFLTMLAAAAGLGTIHAAAALDREVAGKITIQIVDGVAARRDAAAARVVDALRVDAAVRSARQVPPAEIARLLSPWLGSDGGDPDLPMPAMIDATLIDGGDVTVSRVTALVHGAAPAARVDRHQAWMSPVATFMHGAGAGALALVVLMAGATAATVMLAARGGLETHRQTIEVMHMLGATDVQVARLFQRRIARDALVGGLVGGLAAAGAVVLVGTHLSDLGSALLGGVDLAAIDWIVLALMPLGFVALATLAARAAVLSRLRRAL